MNRVVITKDILIEDLIDQYPFSIKFLYQNGIRCIPCGDPVSGTFEEAAKQKGFNDSEIRAFVNKLNELCLQYA